MSQNYLPQITGSTQPQITCTSLSQITCSNPSILHEFSLKFAIYMILYSFFTLWNISALALVVSCGHVVYRQIKFGCVTPCVLVLHCYIVVSCYIVVFFLYFVVFVNYWNKYLKTKIHPKKRDNLFYLILLCNAK